MLVLNRKLGESVVINNDIVVTVVEIRGDKVRLGIVCPKELPVHRQEVYDQIHGKLWVPPPPPPRPVEEEAFLRAIRESPNDEALRLIYADWLEERGDPLGEFVRAQCRRETLTQRARELWARHGSAWSTYLPPSLWM